MKCVQVFTEAWAGSTEGALPGALGVKCPIRSVEEVKDCVSKSVRVQTGGCCSMLSLKDTAQQLKCVPQPSKPQVPDVASPRIATKERALGVWQTRRIETVLMKWDCVPGNLNHILPTFKVNGDMWTESGFAKLQRLNGDSELEAELFHD